MKSLIVSINYNKIVEQKTLQANYSVKKQLSSNLPCAFYLKLDVNELGLGIGAEWEGIVEQFHDKYTPGRRTVI